MNGGVKAGKKRVLPREKAKELLNLLRKTSF